MLSALVACQVQNTALYQLLGRILNLSQQKPEQGSNSLLQTPWCGGSTDFKVPWVCYSLQVASIQYVWNFENDSKCKGETTYRKKLFLYEIIEIEEEIINLFCLMTLKHISLNYTSFLVSIVMQNLCMGFYH